MSWDILVFVKFDSDAAVKGTLVFDSEASRENGLRRGEISDSSLTVRLIASLITRRGGNIYFIVMFIVENEREKIRHER